MAGSVNMSIVRSEELTKVTADFKELGFTIKETSILLVLLSSERSATARQIKSAANVATDIYPQLAFLTDQGLIQIEDPEKIPCKYKLAPSFIDVFSKFMESRIAETADSMNKASDGIKEILKRRQ